MNQEDPEARRWNHVRDRVERSRCEIADKEKIYNLKKKSLKNLSKAREKRSLEQQIPK